MFTWGQVVEFRGAVEARLAKLPFDPAAFTCVPDDGLRRFGLGPMHAAFVWACVAFTVDPLLYPHAISVGGADGRRGLTTATYTALVGADEAVGIQLAYWLASDPPLVRFGLLERDGADFLASATPFRASARLIAHVLGIDPTTLAVQPAHTLHYDDAQRGSLEAIRESLATGRLVVVDGLRGVGRATAIATSTAAPITLLDASRCEPSTALSTVRAACADALLRGAIPILANLDALRFDGGAERATIERALANIVDEFDGAMAITTSDGGLDLPTTRTIDRIHLPVPDVATRLALWTDALEDRPVERDAIQHVALRHKLGAGAIRDAAQGVRSRMDPPILATADLLAGIRGTLADRFGTLAERLVVDDHWSDVVLPAETSDQLESLIARVQHEWTVFEDWKFPRNTARGGGVAALFSGPPGTGKTMVAGLIARELGRDLYRVDLSQIVSKWVGETEKQLGRVFDAAESGNALLLFDEADSLFAKRTEVKSSSDRYANLEVNYLLQRIETFGGMTILTTNLDTSIDPALRRRLASHVVFWPPEYDERVALWQRFLMTRAPTDSDINYEELATAYPDMTGANIRNAALATAFLAARENGSVSNDRIHRAARAEYRAMGRVLSGRGHHG